MSVIGIVGGTGLYELDGLTDKKWQRVDSPFGRPSDELLFGTLGEHQVVFLPRHGRGHKIPPHEIPFLANIDALKRAGVTQVISVSAVGRPVASRRSSRITPKTRRCRSGWRPRATAPC
jgi:5'-methylthioadenosine phosphorylase